jgi:hypothetical protein
MRRLPWAAGLPCGRGLGVVLAVCAGFLFGLVPGAAAPAASAVAESSAGTEPLAPAVVQPELYVVWRRHGIGLERAAVRAIAGVFPRTPARGSPRGEEAAERLQGGPRGKEKDGYDQPA